jgi:regulator of sirC expression with transglutaminase-like and TPR domain
LQGFNTTNELLTSRIGLIMLAHTIRVLDLSKTIEIIKLEPKNYMYFKNRGDAYIGLGEYQKAVNDYE